MDKKMSAKECMMNDDELKMVTGGSGEHPMYTFRCNACGKVTTSTVSVEKCAYCGSTDGTPKVSYF